ncbi:uncharacterized protein BCR38DRAFT_479445 [Pseudomassariella vexata]|uniref:Rhodopsin domain-containing protein n=1 Tax=Pseudomassariella vexata TaxID=1141098 RepID=A0A1Y2EH57_9PEZI|nr:uncharacterized protein BCR38DRAFT_479445 [Pseudomassariella vexata]ORY70911.1 hypothetical protein BCR38DRAFT_479445 [Pseudomassariella vexata]
MVIVSDVAILTIPFKYLFGLQTPVLRKAWIIFAFALGILTVVIVAVRMHLSAKNPGDLSVLAIWCSLEPTVGIIAACIPTFRPLLGRSKYSDDGTMHARNRLSAHDHTRGADRMRSLSHENLSQIQLHSQTSDRDTKFTSITRRTGSRDDHCGDIELSVSAMPSIPVAVYLRKDWNVASHPESNVVLPEEFTRRASTQDKRNCL